MPTFNSSAIKRAEYKDANGALRIWFPSGKAYDYCNVPQHVWDGLCNARSKGTYFNDHIDGRYQC